VWSVQRKNGELL